MRLTCLRSVTAALIRFVLQLEDYVQDPLNNKALQPAVDIDGRTAIVHAGD